MRFLQKTVSILAAAAVSGYNTILRFCGHAAFMKEEPRKMKKNTKVILLSLLALCVLMAALYAVYRHFAPQAQAGDKHITISIVYDDGTQEDHELDTDAEYLLQALEAVAEIDGTESAEYGYTLMTVNGVTADFTTGGAYWAIYVNGEYGMLNLSQQPLEDGGQYTIAYETY